MPNLKTRPKENASEEVPSETLTERRERRMISISSFTKFQDWEEDELLVLDSILERNPELYSAHPGIDLISIELELELEERTAESEIIQEIQANQDNHYDWESNQFSDEEEPDEETTHSLVEVIGKHQAIAVSDVF